MSDKVRPAAGATGGMLTSCPMCGHENAPDATVCAACGHGEVEHNGPAAADPLRAKVRLFRVLVVFSTACLLLLIAEPYVAPALYSQDSLNALMWNGWGAAPIPPFLLWVKVALYVVAAVSLYRFSWPGRLVYTLLLASGAVLTPLSGAYVTVGIGSLLSGWMNMADGAIMVMAWTAPLRERFVRL